MIPKIIHYCWFGNKPKPKSVLRCIKSWRKYCPDYKIVEWNESNYDITCNKYMNDAYNEKKWGFVPDYARVDIVYKYGGIYLDTDVQMIKPFDVFLDCNAFFGFECVSNDYLVALGLGFGAQKGNELIKMIRDNYNSLSFYNDDHTVNLTPSPIINSQVLVNYGFLMNNQNQSIFNHHVFSNEYFSPKNFQTGLTTVTQNTHSIHQYDASWYNNSEQSQKIKRWKSYKRDYFIHTPNRILMRILGEKTYKSLKQKLKPNEEIE